MASTVGVAASLCRPVQTNQLATGATRDTLQVSPREMICTWDESARTPTQYIVWAVNPGFRFHFFLFDVEYLTDYTSLMGQ
jgi:hypothetical protein